MRNNKSSYPNGYELLLFKDTFYYLKIHKKKYDIAGCFPCIFFCGRRLHRVKNKNKIFGNSIYFLNYEGQKKMHSHFY